MTNRCQNIVWLHDQLWSEPGVARLLHFFSTVGGSGSGCSPSSASPTSSGGVEWNLDVVSQFLAADFSHLNWRLVARNLDFPEFSIHGTKQLGVLLRLYRSGPRGYQLPLWAIITITTPFGGITQQLQISPYADEALDASTTVVERGSSRWYSTSMCILLTLLVARVIVLRRPKPGGLRSDQMLVYEAFQKTRQPTASSGQLGSIDGQGAGMDQFGGDQRRLGEDFSIL